MTSLIGQTLNKRYRLDALLGDGGMGTVYRANDLNLERQVAVKLMHSHFARQEEFRARLVQEARTAAALDHPSIVRVYDFGDSEIGLFIAMEYVDGGSLRDHLRRLQRLQKFLPLAQCLQIAIQIAEALDYAHHRKIVHRDVKPGNIILKRLSRPDEAGTQPFRALLTDFGLVKLQEGNSLTQSGATVGTPTYMSPEQCEGRELDGRSDIYSLGVVLYELVTNKLPFTFQTLTEAIAAHQRNLQPTPVGELRPEVPPIIDTLLNRALAKSPDQRYATGAEMADALRSAFIALEGQPTRVMLHRELDILDQVAEPPPGYELHIHTPGHADSIVPLTRAVVAMGRSLDNDIVLPADGVSRHHTRLQATSLGWEVIDLGGVNGTWLDDQRLPPEEPSPLGIGAMMRIGPYELVLHGPDSAILALEADKGEQISGPITPGIPIAAELMSTTSVTRSELPTIPPSLPLAMHMTRDQIVIDPGQQVEVKVDVENKGVQDDRVTVRVQGIDPGWLTVPDEFVPVPAGQTVPVAFAVKMPRGSGTPATRQRIRIEVVSQRYPEMKLGVSAALVPSSFVTFDAKLEPVELRLPGRTMVTIHNTGNTVGQFSVAGREHLQALRFRGEREGIPLQPNQIANIELAVETRQTQWFGDGDVYPFEVEVTAANFGKKVLPGEAITRAVIPTPLLYLALFLITFACVLSAAFMWSNRDRIFGIGSVPTSTPTLSLEQAAATQTSIAFIQTVAIATQSGAATQVALTAAVEGDSDLDGLSNAQETILGTDPNNPDTDGEGVKDGDEVLIYSTNPRNPDTDADGLTDYAEIFIHRTDPNNPDTDRDGIPDGVEVAQGTDPLVPNPPTSTATFPPTSTLVPPTATWTLMPPITATWTPIPTATWTPIPTLAPTAAPSATATIVVQPPPGGPALTCIAAPPVIDGVPNIGTEWTAAPTFTFQPTVAGAERLVRVWAVRDAGNVYFAYIINDSVTESTDSISLYIDTNNNGGDPDTADRFIQITRDGFRLMWAGIGSNSDGLEWNTNYTSTNWTAAVSELGNGQWAAEIRISALAELATLSDPFGLMTQVNFTGDLATYPAGALPSQANTWQDFRNVLCGG